MTPNTQAVLLLCGRFAAKSDDALSPLAPKEFLALARWLRDKKSAPADLLHDVDLTDAPVSADRLTALLERGGALALAAEGWENKGIWVVSRYDDDYPSRLKPLRAQSPPLLYGVGKKELMEAGGLAVVGSREADDEALEYTRRLARTCAAQNVAIVSGGARGVDTEAMAAALEAGGRSLGVLTDNLGRAATAGKWREFLLDGSLVLTSPYDPASGFSVGNAMGRNKYVYALADGAVVISASDGKGGTWEGATEALKEQHVFVRTGENVPPGNARLLEMGALPFPDEPWPDIAAALADVESCAAIPASAPMQNEAVFDAVLPLILPHLDQPQDAQALAERLQVRKEQMKDWLESAVARGAVVKSGKPSRYHRNDTLQLML